LRSPLGALHQAESATQRVAPALKFLDSLSTKPDGGKPVAAPAAAFAVTAAAAKKHRPSSQLAAEMATARGGGRRRPASASGFLMDAAGSKIADAYGVKRSLAREEPSSSGPGGTPSSGWRRVSELEAKLVAVERERAAARLQVEQLRGETCRRGNRIGQLEGLIAQLEEHNRELHRRLRTLDYGANDLREPLPAYAAREIDEAAAAAYEHSLALHERRRTLEGNDEGWWEEEAQAELDHLMGRAPETAKQEQHAGLVAPAGRRAVPWTVGRWVDSLGLSDLLAACLLRHLRSRTRDPSAELAFISGLGARDAKRTVLAVLREGGVLETLAAKLHASSVRVANELQVHTDPALHPNEALRSVHRLRMHRLRHQRSDVVPTPSSTQPTLRPMLDEVPPDSDALGRMMGEHTERKDALAPFYSVELADDTTSACEFWFVHDPLKGLQELGLRDWPGQGLAKRRRMKPWSGLEPAVRLVNEKLARHAMPPLTRAERTASRLFTGPLALKYNALLKFAVSPSAASQEVCDELCMRNGYPTTIAALCAGLRKLASLADASAPLYRCLSTAEAAAVWNESSNMQLTCSSGALSCVSERSAALVAASYAAADDAQSGGSGVRALVMGAAAGGESGGGGGEDGKSGAGAAVGRYGPILLRIEPCGARVCADLNFLSQASMSECREVILSPLTPLQLVSSHVEGSVLVLVATAGRVSLASTRAAHAHSLHVPSRQRWDEPAAAATPLVTPATPAALVGTPAGPSSVAEAATAALRGSATRGGATPGGSGGYADNDASADVVDAGDGTTAAAGPSGSAPPPTSLRRPGNPIEDRLFEGRPWCATDAGVIGRCFFWYHLPEARGGVEMRYRRVGESDWTAHEEAVQVLPGGWWRTGPWPYAGNTSYEQGCWVRGHCVMAGIVGPTESLILAELPPGTSPPSPHGIGSTGDRMVRVEGGRVVGASAAYRTSSSSGVAGGESADERQAALEALFGGSTPRGGRGGAADLRSEPGEVWLQRAT
jgi:hypothetical protein